MSKKRLSAEAKERLLQTAKRANESRIARLRQMTAGDACPRCGHPVEIFPGAPGYICGRCDWRSTELGTPPPPAAGGSAGYGGTVGYGLGLMQGEEP